MFTGGPLPHWNDLQGGLPVTGWPWPSAWRASGQLGLAALRAALRAASQRLAGRPGPPPVVLLPAAWPKGRRLPSRPEADLHSEGQFFNGGIVHGLQSTVGINKQDNADTNTIERFFSKHRPTRTKMKFDFHEDYPIALKMNARLCFCFFGFLIINAKDGQR